jgi:hypothetical protein
MSDEIMKNQQRFDDKSRRIREDQDLSRDAKRRHLGEAYAVARDEHERLVHEHREQTQKNIAAAKKGVMGIKYPQQMLQADREIARMSYRAAYDMAERAATRLRKDPTALADLLERADLSGDDLLSQAVFHIAARKGLRDVSESYLQNRPTEAATYQKLVDANQEANSAAGQMYGWIKPAKPPELLGAAAPGEKLDDIGKDTPDHAAQSAVSEDARTRVNAGFSYPSRTPVDDS